MGKISITDVSQGCKYASISTAILLLGQAKWLSGHLFSRYTKFSETLTFLITPWGKRGGGKSSFCNTPEKRLQNLWPAASEVIVLRLQHHQDNHVAIFIGPKRLFWKKLSKRKIYLALQDPCFN